MEVILAKSFRGAVSARKQAMVSQLEVPSFIVQPSAQEPEKLWRSTVTRRNTKKRSTWLLVRILPSCSPCQGSPHRCSRRYQDFSVSPCQTAINPLLLVGVLDWFDPNILGLIYD